jgi:hypothetical protein
MQSVDRALFQQVIDAACAVRTSVLWRWSSKGRSLIAKKFASQRIDDYFARAGVPFGGITFNRWKTRSAQRKRSVTMDSEIRNDHVHYREQIFLRENSCCVYRQTNVFIDLVFQSSISIPAPRQSVSQSKPVYWPTKMGVNGLPTIDTFTLRKQRNSMSYGRYDNQTDHRQSWIDRFTSQK